MKIYLLPKEDIEKAAIEESIRQNAWLVIPNTMSITNVLSLAKEMGFEDVLKVIYCKDMLEKMNENSVYLYAEEILEELMNNSISKNSCFISCNNERF